MNLIEKSGDCRVELENTRWSGVNKSLVQFNVVRKSVTSSFGGESCLYKEATAKILKTSWLGGC